MNMNMHMVGLTEELAVGTLLKNATYTVQENIMATANGFGYLAKDDQGVDVQIREFFIPDLSYRQEDLSVAAKKAENESLLRKLVKNFIRDARFLQSLDSKYVGKVREVFEENGTAYLVSDTVDGQRLSDLLAANKAFKPREVVRIAHGLFKGLIEIHGFGMLHRDINPSNIVITESGDAVLLTDFSTFREDNTRASKIVSSTVRASQEYAPYEFIIDTMAQSEASDLYSVAAVVSHLITGEKPAGCLERISAVARDEEDPQSNLLDRVEGYDRRFLHVLDYAMELFLKHRLKTAGEALTLMNADGDFKEIFALRSDAHSRRDEVDRLGKFGWLKTRIFSKFWS